MTFQATKLDGSAATDFNNWKFYLANAGTGDAGLGTGNTPYNVMTWTPSSATLAGTGVRAPGGNPAEGVGYDVTMGMLQLSPTERYSTVTITVETKTLGR